MCNFGEYAAVIRWTEIIFYFPTNKVNWRLSFGDCITGKELRDHSVQRFYFIDGTNGACRKSYLSKLAAQ